MKTKLFTLAVLFTLFVSRIGATETHSGYPLTQEGAWCWFADPRAIHYTNSDSSINASYIGYIDVHGNVKAMQMDYNTGRQTEVLVRSYFQPDDHNNPTFLVLPDERILIIYSRHTDEPAFYYRVSKYPGDITILGEEKCIKTNHNTTYPSPFLMSDDPEHFYLCWRGIGWHPTIARLTLPDENDDVEIAWGPYQMIQSTGARPYAKYYSNGKDKLYMTYTTGHPDNELPNWVYFNVISLNACTTSDGTIEVAPTLEDIKGNRLSMITDGKFAVNKSDNYKNTYPYTIVDAPTGYRDWVWQIACDKGGQPSIAMVRISSDKNQHQYYYAKWTGSTWRLTDLANGGGRFHPSNTEYCYSGGEAIDPENPNIIYLSIPTSGTTGKKVYEIWKYTLDEKGAVVDKEQMTHNSEKNNVRPFVLPGSAGSPMRLLWMNGDYYYWLVRQGYPAGFPTAIHADYKWPATSIDLESGLVHTEKHNALAMNVSDKKAVKADNYETFTLNAYLQIDANEYHGTLLTIDNLSYGLDKSTTTPYIRVGDTQHTGSNKLYTSDNWALYSNSTGGDHWPTPLQSFNLTLSYDGHTLIVYRNGLIDQAIETQGLSASDITIGGYKGILHQTTLYNRALKQEEVKQLILEQALEYLTVPDTITSDIILPTKCGGESVTWISDTPSVLATDGTCRAGESSTKVTLTATIQKQTRTFTVTVLPRDISKNLLLRYTFDTEDSYTTEEGTFVRNKGIENLDLKVMGNATIDGTLNLTRNAPANFATNGYAIAPAKVMDGLRSYTVLLTATPQSLDKQPRLYDFGHNSGNSLFLRANALAAGIKYNGGTTTMTSSSAQLSIGTPNQIAVTYDARSRTTRIFINGELVGSGTENSNEGYMIAAGSTCTRNYIGRTQWWDSNVAGDNADYVGTIDDFTMYNIALNDEEIAAEQNIRTEDETLNVDYSHILTNRDFESSYKEMSGAGTTSDRAIYIPNGWTAEYTTRCKDDMTILNNSCLYASLFSSIPTTNEGGSNAYLVRQKWGTSTISMSQPCDTLPAGYYSLEADMWQSGLGGSASIWVETGNKNRNTGSAPGNAEAWQSGKASFSCNGSEKVIFGFSATHTSNGSEKFLGFDNFQLFNTTANRSEIEIHTLLTEMTPIAKELLKGDLNSDVRNLLENAIRTTEELTSNSPHAELLEAYYIFRDAIAQRNKAPEVPDHINTSHADTLPLPIYNLKGQRIPSSSTNNANNKGIFIVNKRKIIM